MGISTISTISWISLSLWFSISRSLVISITMGVVINNLGVMTNNLGAMASLDMGLVTLLMDDILTLFNVGGVNDGLALLSWDLSLILLGNLVALVINMVLAVGSRRVTLVTSLSLSISTGVTSMNLLRIMTNNLGAVVNLGVLFLTVSGDNLLTLFNVGGVNNDVIFLMTFLSLVLDWLLVALLVWLAEALEVVVTSVSWDRSADSSTSEQKSSAKFVHHLEVCFFSISSHQLY